MPSKAQFFCPADGTCENDIFVNGLRKIFSPDYINSIIAGTHDKAIKVFDNVEYPIQIITHSLAIVTTILLGLYLIWVLYSHLVKMSQTGQAIDERNSTPLMNLARPLYSFILVFPTAYGFPLVVHILLVVAMLSNGTANWLMNNFTKTPLTMSTPFLFEQATTNKTVNGKTKTVLAYTVKGKPIYKTGNQIRSVGGLREINHLKKPAYIGFQHGLCLKHWSQNGMDSYSYFARSPAFGEIDGGIVKVSYFDLSQKGWIEQARDSIYGVATGAHNAGVIGLNGANNTLKASGSANPICGDFSVDFVTPLEVAQNVGKSTSHTNQDLEIVQDIADTYKDTLAYRGAIVNNVRAVYQIQAYLAGLDYALGNQINGDLKNVRDMTYRNFHEMAKIAMTSETAQTINNNSSRTKIHGLGKGGAYRDFLSQQTRHTGAVMSAIGASSFMAGQQANGIKPNGFAISELMADKADPLNNLFALVDSQFEPNLDKSHYQIIGGNISDTSQPDLSFFEKQLQLISERVQQNILSKGWLNAGNATSIARKLNEMINSNLLSDTSDGHFYAMDMQTSYDDDLDGINEHAKAINGAISLLNKKAGAYSQDYVGTAIKIHAMMSTSTSSTIQTADSSLFDNLVTGEFIASIERSMLNGLMGTKQANGFSQSGQIFESMRNTGEIALVSGLVVDGINRGLLAGATATDNPPFIGGFMMGAVSTAIKTAYAVLSPTLTELGDFLDNLHTFFSITIPMLPNIMLVLAGLGAFIQLVVTAITVVLYMVLHAKPDRTFVGSNIQLYLLFLNVFLRPVLIYSAFLMTSIILSVIIPIAIDIWFNAKTDILSENAQSGLFTTLWVLGNVKKSWYVLAGLITGITYITASLIQEIPEMVASIMNTNVYPVMGALNSERFINQLAHNLSGGQRYRQQAISQSRSSHEQMTRDNQMRANQETDSLEQAVKEKERAFEHAQSQMGGTGIGNRQEMVTKARDELEQARQKLQTHKDNIRNHSGVGMFRSRKATSSSINYGTTSESIKNRWQRFKKGNDLDNHDNNHDNGNTGDN